MSLNYTKFQKLLRVHFEDIKNPIIEKNKSKHESFFTDLIAQFEKSEKYNWDIITASSMNESYEKVLRFNIIDPDSTYYYINDSFDIYFTNNNEFKINGRYDFTKEAILSFVEILHKEYKIKQNKKLKREKIKDLKKKVIISSIKEMAKEDGFEYSISSDTQKVKLHVRIQKTNYILIEIPYGKFQDALLQIRETIKGVEDLFKNGLKIQVRKYTSSTRIYWEKEE